MYKILIACLLSSSFMFANMKEISKDEVSKIEQVELLKRNNIKVLKAFDAGDLYILIIQQQNKTDEIFLTKDKKYLITGDVINAKTASKLTIPVDLSITKNKEAFVYGDGKDEFVLFTDPECIYCKKLESYLSQIKDKVKIRVFLFPLDFHENARDLSLYILSKKTTKEKIDAMYEFNIGDDLSKIKNIKYSKTNLKKIENKLEEHLSLGKTLNVKGTPAIFDKNGNNIVWVELLNRYNIKVK